MGVAFGHWCDAVLSYLANLDKASDKSISLETFSSEVFPAYEIMFNTWMTSGESKVRLATVQAIGNMCAVMPQEQFEAQLPRIIPGVLALYKKEKNHLPITQALTMVLSVGVKNGSQMESQITNVLNTIHPLACQPGIFEQPEHVKNANELLRCFEIIGYLFSDMLISYLLLRLDIVKQKNVTIRSGTINIIRHLVTRLGMSHSHIHTLSRHHSLNYSLYNSIFDRCQVDRVEALDSVGYQAFGRE